MGKTLKIDVIVIGAGLAGLTAASQLSEAGKAVAVLESSQFVGGMARTISLFGRNVDIGPHRFFSANERVDKFYLSNLDRGFSLVSRKTRILYRNKLYDYPLKPTNALPNMGLSDSVAAAFSYLLAKIRPPRVLDTFEGWVIPRFGKRLYEAFFKNCARLPLLNVPCAKPQSL